MRRRWTYLDRAVDNQGNTIDFLLTVNPRILTVDRNLPVPRADGAANDGDDQTGVDISMGETSEAKPLRGCSPQRLATTARRLISPL